MFAVGVCDLPATGGSTFVVVAGLILLVAGVIVSHWVRQSAGRVSVVVAPLVLLGGLVFAPLVTDSCATTTTSVAVTTTTVAPTTTTTLAPVVYSVGQTGPGGGIVFYDAGSTQSWGRYLEVACAGWQTNCNGSVDPQAEWGCYGTAITRAEGVAIGDGRQNTDVIVASCGTDGIAARLADNYSRNTFDDWFLPSQDELNALCKWAYGDTENAFCNNSSFGGLSLTYGGFSTDWYSSSSETDDTGNAYNEYAQNFTTGSQGTNYKNLTPSVRPVRAF